MRKFFHSSAFVVATVAGLATISCDKAPKGDEAVITDQVLPKEGVGQTFVVDTANSWIKFTGHGVGKNHPGTFKLSYGKVMATDSRITGGTFVMDITSLDLEQEGEMFDKKLRPHLLSGDFFDAATFGTSKFEITKVEPYKSKEGEKSLVDGANFLISGNLQVKNVTKNITFPARVDLDGDRLETKANFDIDRTQWQMNYGNDKTLGDKFISETVNIELNLRALRDNTSM
jgi:polyisoprenoid-binding protein YceI